jgi:uncharacterized membrane protein
MDWLEFAAALLVFMASHVVPARSGMKGALVSRLGHRGYGVVFGLLSIVLLWWVIVAAARAPFVPLWDQQAWMRWLVNTAMPLVVLLICLSIAAPNPLSFGGRASGFDPARPGLAGVVRHPLLWALLIWSLAHMLVNGDLAHVILFGLFALYAAVGMSMIDRRLRRKWGADAWVTRASATSNLPFGGNWRGYWPEWWRIALAVAVWAGLLHLHLPVIGVSPLP